MFNKKLVAVAIASAMASMTVIADEMENSSEMSVQDEIVVSGSGISFANNAITEGMKSQQTEMTSILSVVDNLPGVNMSEGDQFGGDDWSTVISMRGFVTNLDEQQIGMTIDGLPNGGSNYGGGSKANRYIDSLNSGGVEVSQGTADIASRSHEALGGTMNFLTDAPAEVERMRVHNSQGDNDASKYYMRYDTGLIGEDTYAWVSASSQSAKSWIEESGESNRDHAAAKIISQVGGVELTSYAMIDKTHEDNYQRVSVEQFEENPDWDRLTSEWTGIPYVDQAYRKGWSTLRKNAFAYIKADFDAADSISVKTAAYYHKNSGRGDWLPPYMVDTETGSLVYFVDADGNALTADSECSSSITFPYGGAGANYDADCYEEGAIPVSSYRHTHYRKQRWGLTADASMVQQLGETTNTVTAGIWYENNQRFERRDWHEIIDPSTGYEFDGTPYYEQYSLEFPTETIKYYIQDEIMVGDLTANLGVKQFLVETTRKDWQQGGAETAKLNSDSDLLWSAGLVYQLPIDGLEAFAGYAENFAAIKDSTLEDGEDYKDLEPETAKNYDLGARYFGERFDATFTLYQTKFDNRLFYMSADDVSGIDYLESDGQWTNGGGIESQGIEASVQGRLTDAVNMYAAYTMNDSKYLGTGDANLDAVLLANTGIEDGNTVVGSADNMFVVSFDAHRGKSMAGISTKYVSSRYMEPSNTTEAPEYTVTDFYAGVKVEGDGSVFQALDIRMTVNNLFNERYIGGISGTSGWLGATRSTVLSVTADF